MKVTAADRHRGGVYQITLSDGTVTSVDKNTWDESAYRVGSSLSTREWEDLLAESDRRHAKEKAMYLLSIKDYTGLSMRRKLTEAGVSPQTAEQTVARLQELGLIDDERYAARLAKDLLTFKGYPCRRIEQELRAKGIDRDIARAAAEDAAADTDEEQLAVDFLKRKYYNKCGDEAGRRRATAALLRAGFDYDTVRRAIDRLVSGE